MVKLAECCAAVALAACAAAGSAEAQPLEEFTLDTLVVTADRVQNQEIKSASAVEVIDARSIASSGAGNAFAVLGQALGVSTLAPGINGMSMGSLTSTVQIRGVDKGTLVLVDGVALNQDGKYNLEDIPAEIIERIEIVRGGGAVLYGSEATGGVINIITKKAFSKNKLKLEAGSYARQRYAAQLAAGKLAANLHYRHRGQVNNYAEIGGQAYDYLRGEGKGALWSYKLDEAWSLSQNYLQNEHKILALTAAGTPASGSIYKDTTNSLELRYAKAGWQALASYNTQEKNYDSLHYAGGVYQNTTKYSWRKGKNLAIDVQKSLELPAGSSLLFGADYKREQLDLYSTGRTLAASCYQRNVYSLYASYGWQLAAKTKVNFNARETWATDTFGSQTNLITGEQKRNDTADMRRFTPEVQLVQQLTQASSLYAKAGKSFRLPNLTQLYGTGALLPVLALRPESGVHYELGYKADGKRDVWRLALFKYALKDAISYKSGDSLLGTVEYTNKSMKNTGLELAYRRQHDAAWSTSWGAAWSNPRLGGSLSTDDNWYDVLSSYQLQGSVNYAQKKFSARLQANYYGGRKASNASGSSIKPLLATDIHLAYQPQAEHNIYLHVNNLFDRRDLVNAGAAGGRPCNYYTLGRNFQLGYECSF